MDDSNIYKNKKMSCSASIDPFSEDDIKSFKKMYESIFKDILSGANCIVEPLEQVDVTGFAACLKKDGQDVSETTIFFSKESHYELVLSATNNVYYMIIKEQDAIIQCETIKSLKKGEISVSILHSEICDELKYCILSTIKSKTAPETRVALFFKDIYETGKVNTDTFGVEMKQFKFITQNDTTAQLLQSDTQENRSNENLVLDNFISNEGKKFIEDNKSKLVSSLPLDIQFYVVEWRKEANSRVLQCFSNSIVLLVKLEQIQSNSDVCFLMRCGNSLRVKLRHKQTRDFYLVILSQLLYIPTQKYQYDIDIFVDQRLRQSFSLEIVSGIEKLVCLEVPSEDRLYIFKDPISPFETNSIHIDLTDKTLLFSNVDEKPYFLYSTYEKVNTATCKGYSITTANTITRSIALLIRQLFAAVHSIRNANLKHVDGSFSLIVNVKCGISNFLGLPIEIELHLFDTIGFLPR